MSSRLNLLVESLRSAFRGFSFDESCIHEIRQYYDVISTSPKTRALNETDRTFVIAVVSENAVTIARKRHLNIINASLFKESLLEYKGPIRPPDDKCESAADNIYRNRKLYESQLSGEIRRLFQAS